MPLPPFRPSAALGLVLLGTVAACGGGGPGDNPGATVSRESPANVNPIRIVGPPPDTLTGLWDVTGSEIDGQTHTGTVTIAPDSLNVSFGDYVLQFHDDAGTARRRSTARRSKIRAPTSK